MVVGPVYDFTKRPQHAPYNKDRVSNKRFPIKDFYCLIVILIVWSKKDMFLSKIFKSSKKRFRKKDFCIVMHDHH